MKEYLGISMRKKYQLGKAKTSSTTFSLVLFTFLHLSSVSAQGNDAIDSEDFKTLFVCALQGANSPNLSRLIVGERSEVTSLHPSKYFLKHGNYNYPNIGKNGSIFSGSNSFTPWARSIGFDVETGMLYEVQVSLDPSYRQIIEWVFECIATDPEKSH